MNRRLLFLLSGLMLSVASLNAQERPNFSGTWIATQETSAGLAAAPTPVLGPQFTLRHDGQRLAVTRVIRGTSVSVTFPLDGSEVRSRVPGTLCTADSESIETAAWDGSAIALTATGSVPPAGTTVVKLNVKRMLRLDSANALIVEGSLREPASSTPRAVGTVYKRSGDPTGAAPASEPAKVQGRIVQLAWLSGIWLGANGSDERWTPAASGSMIGVSRTLRNDVMTAFEFLCIVERGGGLVYQAMPNGRSPATDFSLTKLEATSVTFENPAHDFPKAIRYSLLPDGTLEAVVSGDPRQRAVTFTFKRP